MTHTHIQTRTLERIDRLSLLHNNTVKLRWSEKTPTSRSSVEVKFQRRQQLTNVLNQHCQNMSEKNNISMENGGPIAQLVRASY